MENKINPSPCEYLYVVTFIYNGESYSKSITSLHKLELLLDSAPRFIVEEVEGSLVLWLKKYGLLVNNQKLQNVNLYTEDGSFIINISELSND